MGQLKKYSSSIYRLYKVDNVEGLNSTTFAPDIISGLTNRYEEYSGDKLTDYFMGIKKEDLTPFNTSFDMLISGRERPENLSSDVGILENVLADLSTISVWQSIREKYTTGEEVFGRLKNKEYPTEFTVDKSMCEKQNIIEYLETLNSEGLNINFVETVQSPKLEFEKINKFLQILVEDVVLEEVRQAVNRIIERMDTLYVQLYRNNYIGLLLENGDIIYSNMGSKNKYEARMQKISTYLSVFAGLWGQSCEVPLTKTAVSFERDDGRALSFVFNENGIPTEYGYYPFMHKKYMNDGSIFHKDKDKIRKALNAYLSKIKEENPTEYTNYQMDLEKQFTNCLIITDVNQHTLQLRLSYVPVSGFETFSENVEIGLKKMASGAEEIKILKNSLNSKFKDILNVTLIYSMSAFEQEVLFAHKLYTGPNAISPNVTKPILGVKMDGSLFRENLFSDKFTTILAGSRSGKGTLTQSLLAPLIAEGYPIIYLDNKPDIASLFWDLENKFKGKGKDVKFLAIDSKDQGSTFIKDELSAAPRGQIFDENGNLINLANLPSNTHFSLSSLKLIRTYKTLQLLFLAGELAANNKLSHLDKFVNYVFIDEITDLSIRINDLYNSISSVTEPGKRATEEENSLYEWTKGLCGIIKDVNTGFSTMKTMISDKHNFKFIMIGQVFNEKWLGNRHVVNKIPELNIGTFAGHFVYSGMALCKNWLSGREQVTAARYNLPATELEMAKKTGVFYYHKGIPNGPDNILGTQPIISGGNLFRSYFALVRNDVGNTVQDITNAIESGETDAYFNEYQDVGYTNKFLYNRNVFYGSQDVKQSLNELYDFENDRPVRGVGFDGLLEDISDLLNLDLYSDSLVQKLNAPYERLEWVLSNAGIMDERNYTCLEDYLYDCDVDSFYTQETIKERFWKGYNNAGVYPISESVSQVYIDYMDSEEVQEVLAEKDKKIKEIVNNEELSDTEKELFKRDLEKDTREQLNNLVETEEGKKQQLSAKRDALEKVNNLKSKIGAQLSQEGKKLYQYKQNEILFNNFKQSIFERRLGYEKDFSDIISEIDLDSIRQEMDTMVELFLNEQFDKIDRITFDVIQKKEKTLDDGGKSTQSFGGSIEDNSKNIVNQPSSPIQEPKGRSINIPNNNKKVESRIDTADLQYNINNLDSIGNVKASNQLTQQVIKDIKQQFGGVNNIEEITITANGCLVINNYSYLPSFSEQFVSSLGQAIQNDVLNGQLNRIVNLGKVVNSIVSNVFSISIESPKIAYSTLFKNELGVGKNYGVLFRKYGNLQTIYLPDEELNRNNPNSSERMGLGSKLSNLFGFGLGDKKSSAYVPNPAPTYNGNSLIDKMFESKPVRIMTGAFGWTMGVKAVVLAATIFGPWGLLFGALAMTGAYNELKENKNNKGTTNTNRNNSRSSTGSKNNKNTQKSNQKNNQRQTKRDYDDDNE